VKSGANGIGKMGVTSAKAVGYVAKKTVQDPKGVAKYAYDGAPGMAKKCGVGALSTAKSVGGEVLMVSKASVSIGIKTGQYALGNASKAGHVIGLDDKKQIKACEALDKGLMAIAPLELVTMVLPCEYKMVGFLVFKSAWAVRIMAKLYKMHLQKAPDTSPEQCD
jgi:hypothetical protein